MFPDANPSSRHLPVILLKLSGLCFAARILARRQRDLDRWLVNSANNVVLFEMLVPLIIAIDGPSGSGKSTLGQMLARELGLLYIDTGSMYRAVSLAVMESTVNESDDVAVGSLAERIGIDLGGDPDSLRASLNGKDVRDRIRAEDVQPLALT